MKYEQKVLKVLIFPGRYAVMDAQTSVLNRKEKSFAFSMDGVHINSLSLFSGYLRAA